MQTGEAAHGGHGVGDGHDCRGRDRHLARPSPRRDARLDMARVLGIVLVVHGHALGTLPLFPPYAFHMPLFFLVSGLLHRHDATPQACVARLWRRLLRPMLGYLAAFGLALWLLDEHTTLGRAWRGLHSLTLDPFLGATDVPFAYGFWFLATLFLAALTTRLCRGLLARGEAEPRFREDLLLLGTWLAAGLGLAYARREGLAFPPGEAGVAAGRLLWALLFFQLGVAARRHGGWEAWTRRWDVLLGCLLAQTLLASLAPVADFSQMFFHFGYDPVVTLLANGNGCLFALCLAVAFTRAYPDSPLPRLIGGRTLPILALHLYCFFCVSCLFATLEGRHMLSIQGVYDGTFMSRHWPWHLLAGLAAPALFSWAMLERREGPRSPWLPAARAGVALFLLTPVLCLPWQPRLGNGEVAHMGLANATRLLGTGWDAPEGWGVWSVAPNATLVLDPRPFREKARCQLRLIGQLPPGREAALFLRTRRDTQPLGPLPSGLAVVDAPASLLRDPVTLIVAVHRAADAPPPPPGETRALEYALSHFQLACH